MLGQFGVTTMLAQFDVTTVLCQFGAFTIPVRTTGDPIAGASHTTPINVDCALVGSVSRIDRHAIERVIDDEVFNT